MKSLPLRGCEVLACPPAGLALPHRGGFGLHSWPVVEVRPAARPRAQTQGCNEKGQCANIIRTTQHWCERVRGGSGLSLDFRFAAKPAELPSTPLSAPPRGIRDATFLH
jgi:hypothetical protein